MERKQKIWLIIGLFIVAAIIALAIYKGVGSSKTTEVITGGGTHSETTPGLGKLIIDWFKF